MHHCFVIIVAKLSYCSVLGRHLQTNYLCVFAYLSYLLSFSFLFSYLTLSLTLHNRPAQFPGQMSQEAIKPGFGLLC